MKTLYLVRHAKSSWEDGKLKDWERPLLELGIQRAKSVAKILKKKKINPDKIISSHAFRALNTAVIFSLCMDYPVDRIEVSYDIYGKKPCNILDLIKRQDDTVSSLMIFGHNPVFTDLYNLLAGEKLENLSTSSAACIHFATDHWSKIHTKKGKCMFLVTGK